MKLLNSFVSPFAARVRVAIYAYDLPVEIAPSGQWTPDWRKAPEYLAINPIGLVPALVLDDGRALPESSVIVEYLADACAENALLPLDPEDAARARLLAHLAELYVQTRGAPLIGQLFAAEVDRSTIEERVAAMDEGLSYLEHFMGDAPFDPDGDITVADCALAPILFFFAERMPLALGSAPILGKRPKLARYWDAVQKAPAVAKVLDEMRTAIGESRVRALLAG